MAAPRGQRGRSAALLASGRISNAKRKASSVSLSLSSVSRHCQFGRTSLCCATTFSTFFFLLISSARAAEESASSALRREAARPDNASATSFKFAPKSEIPPAFGAIVTG